MKDLELDINQIPSGVEEECVEKEFGGLPRKKLRLTKEQSHVLEQSFKQYHILNPKQKEGLADQLKLKPRQVEVWFQNRRARSKLKQTEMEYKNLKKWFGSLNEQNRKLKKEVEELRGRKAGPPQQLPAATLTMCPRCQHVTNTFLDKGPAARKH
ncbi:homeobox-leucine zipper HOX3 [Olea europaea subsp. europaea]|uniref:Homeobox-leucine zipper HOX3 n=1 Tax=Olea europaea subsp. europaea TaxID=158383 RepID=A0A8S0TCS6_OLEEU|nr:homeobox-leucine zipper HOX3 [Olea europaea subsp. europaea]